MNRFAILSLLSLLPACGSSSNGGGPTGQPDASGLDAEQDVTTPDDATNAGDAPLDSSSSDTGAGDTGAIVDSGAPADSSVSIDSGASVDATCPASWLAAPAVDVAIEVPADGGAVILHA